MIALLFVSLFLHADDRVTCARLLNVPAAFARHFLQYTNATYLAPLPHARIENIGIYRDVHLYNQSPDDVDEDEVLSAHARVKTDNSQAPRWLTFETLTLSDQLDPGLVYRTLLAHLLNAMPGVREIDFDLYALPDYGVTRGRLARGTDLTAAMAATDAAEALRDFGFTNLRAQAKFVDEREPRELILRMRASRP